MNSPIPISFPPLRVIQPGPGMRFQSFHVGNEIAFEDMVNGEHYFRKFSFGPYNNVEDNYEEIILVEKLRDNQGNLTGEYSYRIPAPIHFYENWRGRPMTPVPVAEAPLPQGFPARNEIVHFDFYRPQYERFFTVSSFQRARHLVANPIKEKMKKNIRRKHLNTILDRTGLSTNLGTGPANIIREYLDFQPPKGTRRVFPPMRPGPHPHNIALRKAPLPYGPTEDNFAGGKRKRNKRKTRKHT